jgi:hypothetical protein
MSDDETVPEVASTDVPPPPPVQDNPGIGEYFQRGQKPFGEDIEVTRAQSRVEHT